MNFWNDKTRIIFAVKWITRVIYVIFGFALMVLVSVPITKLLFDDLTTALFLIKVYSIVVFVGTIPAFSAAFLIARIVHLSPKPK